MDTFNLQIFDVWMMDSSTNHLVASYHAELPVWWARVCIGGDVPVATGAS